MLIDVFIGSRLPLFDGASMQYSVFLSVVGVVIIQRDDAVKYGEPSDIRRVPQAERMHQLLAVLFNRFEADAEFFGGLLVRVAECDKPRYLTHPHGHWWFFQCHLFI